ncbi:MAG: carbamoyltransferase HypF [Thermodesulfovibrionales bacterium]|jgi:hydrogenase maturation protein HypF
MVERAQIRVKGIVQGVGFRPYIYKLAESLRLKGYVTNTSDGVNIDVEGENLVEFIERLPRESPPLSRIVDIAISPMPEFGYADFRIIESRDDGSRTPFTLISADVSTCDDCLKELLDPANRRYLYPFVNCTNCGPRYTITKRIPYDRPNTTMAFFQMCPACSEEYHDPRDRRFHAQPNACPQCGPKVALVTMHNTSTVSEQAVERTIAMLREGKIVAIKGLGGFHIACDAANEDAVQRLRARKRRNNKPFALMAPSVDAIERFCEVSGQESRLLLSKRRPIVLLKKRDGSESCLPEAVSPHNRYLGFMLPYTPLHYLLFFSPTGQNQSPRNSHFHALVMTSGNLSEEPIVKDNDEAITRLSGLVDAFLIHDRDIFMRVDDSVLRVAGPQSKVNGRMSTHQTRVFGSATLFVRRSRGYAPEPIALQADGPEVMGCGADLKNTFTVTKGSFAIPSQHIGDMENYETVQFFEECLENVKGIYRAGPVAVGHDLHPGYLSTQWALRQGGGNARGLRTYGIQHHYAHIASVMAENGLSRKVLGVAFDGTGYGTDGNLWGGEFLVADIEGFERSGHFRYIPLPGGETAIREPWRTAVSYLLDASGDEVMDYLSAIGFVERYGKNTLERVIKVINAAELSPLSSGAGRLFDAVSALIGLCDRNTFEGEAAMALEALIDEETEDDYPVNITADETVLVDFSPAIIGIADDFVNGVNPRRISAKFHNSVSNVILKVLMRFSEMLLLKDVVLSGGTFQNAYLLRRTTEMLTSNGLNTFINRALPCNDACISLGQAYLVRERLKGMNTIENAP